MLKILSLLLILSIFFWESCSDKKDSKSSSTYADNLEANPEKENDTKNTPAENYNYVSPETAIKSIVENPTPVSVKVETPQNISKNELIINAGFNKAILNDDLISLEVEKDKSTTIILSNINGEPVYISLYTPKDTEIKISSLTTAISIIASLPYISFYTRDKSFKALVNELSSMQEIKTLVSEIEKNIAQNNSAFSNRKEFLDAVYNAYLAVLKKYSGTNITTLALNLSNLNTNPHIEAFIDYENSSPPKFKIDVKNVSGKYVVVYIDKDGDNTDVFGKPSSTNPYLANGLLLKPNETGSFEIDLSTLKDKENIPPIKVYTIGNRFLSLVDNVDRWLVPAVLNINDINFIPTLNTILPNITSEKNCSLILVENVSNRIINDPTVFTKVKELIIYDKSPNTLVKITDVILSNFFRLAYENFLLKGNIRYRTCLEDQLISILKNEKKLSDEDSKAVASSIVSRISDSQLKLITNILFISQKTLQKLQTSTDYLNKLSNKIAYFYQGDAFQKILIEDKLVLKPKYEKTVYNSNNAEVVITCGIEKVPCTEITVDWGDGNKDTLTYTEYEEDIILNHEYKTVGNYTVTIIARDKEGSIAIYKKDIEVRKKLAIISTTPKNNAEDIDPKSTNEIVIKFKENIDPNLISKEVIRFTETNLETGQITEVPYSYLIRNKNELVITPTNQLNEFSKYSIIIEPLKYTDGSLSSAFELIFETIDNRPLLIQKITPTPGTKLPENNNLNIEIEFNRQLKLSTLNSNTVWIEDQYGKKLSTNLSVSGNKIYLTTDSSINTTYTYILKISKDITDIKNHKLGKDKEFAYSGNNSSSGIYKKVIMLKDGSFVVAGEFGLNTDKPFVVVKRFSKDGKELWQYTYSSDNGYKDKFLNLKLLDDGNIAVDILNQGKGYYIPKFTDTNNPNPTPVDGFDGDGLIETSAVHNTTENDQFRYAFRVILSPDGKFLRETPNTDSVCESFHIHGLLGDGLCFYIKERNLLIYVAGGGNSFYLRIADEIFSLSKDKSVTYKVSYNIDDIGEFLWQEGYYSDSNLYNNTFDNPFKVYISKDKSSMVVYMYLNIDELQNTNKRALLLVNVDLNTFNHNISVFDHLNPGDIVSNDDKFKVGYTDSGPIYEDIYLSYNSVEGNTYIVESTNQKILCNLSGEWKSISSNIVFKNNKCYALSSFMDHNLAEKNVYASSQMLRYEYIETKGNKINKIGNPIRFGSLRSIAYHCKILEDLSVICAGYENGHYIPINTEIGKHIYESNAVIKMFDKNLNLKWKGF